MKEEAEEGQHGVAVLGREETLWVFGFFCYIFFLSLSLQFSTFSPMAWEDDGRGGGLTAWCGRGLRSVDDVVTASTTASTSHDCTAEKKRHLHTLATQEHTNKQETREKNKERFSHVTVKPAFRLDAALRRWPWRERCVERDRGDIALRWRGLISTSQQALLWKRKSSPPESGDAFLRCLDVFSACLSETTWSQDGGCCTGGVEGWGQWLGARPIAADWSPAIKFWRLGRSIISISAGGRKKKTLQEAPSSQMKRGHLLGRRAADEVGRAPQSFNGFQIRWVRETEGWSEDANRQPPTMEWENAGRIGVLEDTQPESIAK